VASGGRLLVKICGVRDQRAINAASSAGADIVGFVFASASPRQILPAEAGRLSTTGLARCGLFVDQSVDEICATVRAAGLDLVQLHGDESDETIASVRDLTDRPVIAARGVASTDDLAGLPGAADILLLDAKPPPGPRQTGGHGQTFDWDILADKTFGKPWILAGGLRPETVAAAVRRFADSPTFCGVDVSSGVESRRGEKDPARIAAFVAAARTAIEGQSIGRDLQS
jgi:phosphoribosylanthranilate isomerase